MHMHEMDMELAIRESADEQVDETAPEFSTAIHYMSESKEQEQEQEQKDEQKEGKEVQEQQDWGSGQEQPHTGDSVDVGVGDSADSNREGNRKGKANGVKRVVAAVVEQRG
jgi:phage terminase small subunit